MKAAVLEAMDTDPVLMDVEVSGPAPDEVLIRVVASGICHTDRHAQHVQQGRPLPILLGHEPSGIVEQVGDRVTTVQVGDHVVATASAYCGRCRWCLSGRTQHCEDKGQSRADGSPRLRVGDTEIHPFVGLGAFATHMLVSERATVRLPDEMPLDKGALLGCSVLTGIGAVRHVAKVESGQSVAVIGCGGVGLNAIQAAALVGARQIIAVDLNPAKLDRAREFGATDVVDASATDPVEAVLALSGTGVDHALEIVGIAPTVEQAFAMTDTGGCVTIVGVSSPEARISLSPWRFMFSEKRLQGCRLGGGNFRVDIPLYSQMYLAGQLKLDELISEVVDLSDVPRGLVALDNSDGARSVIHFD